MITLVAGGQTGADFGAMKAARASGVAIEGYAPKGWLIEGPGGKGWESAPWLAEWGLEECQEDGFPARTSANVAMSDIVIWFGPTGSTGYQRTAREADSHGKPLWHVAPEGSSISKPSDLVMFLRRDGIRRFMAAGNRESKCPGIEDRVFRFLTSVFRAMAKEVQHARGGETGPGRRTGADGGLAAAGGLCPVVVRRRVHPGAGGRGGTPAAGGRPAVRGVGGQTHPVRRGVGWRPEGYPGTHR